MKDTPTKGLLWHLPSTGRMLRDEVAQSLVETLLGRQWKSSDLVAHILGDIISPSLVVKIVLLFLHFNLLSVTLDKKVIQKTQWIAACASLLAGVDR